MEVISFIQSFANPVLDALFETITMVGEDYFFILVFGFVFWCSDKRAGYRLGFAYLTSAALNVGLKETIKAPRPVGEAGVRSLRLETAGGYSWPSGHTQLTASLWTSIIIEGRERSYMAIGIPLMILVALSRVYLGVHWPVDVISGLLIGAAWVVVANMIFKAIDQSPGKVGVWIVVAVVLMLAIFFRTPDYMKGSGVMVGFLLGYLVETKYIDFSEKGSWLIQAAKMVGGLVVLLALKVGLKFILPPGLIGDFIRYFCIGAWMTAIWPWAFSKLNVSTGGSVGRGVERR